MVAFFKFLEDERAGAARMIHDVISVFLKRSRADDHELSQFVQEYIVRLVQCDNQCIVILRFYVGDTFGFVSVFIGDDEKASSVQLIVRNLRLLGINHNLIKIK